MADQFNLSGSYSTQPLDGSLSFAPIINAAIDEAVSLAKKQAADIDLAADAPVSVTFGGLTNAHVVILKAVGGGPVRARLTSADGAQQSIPFDTYLILMSQAKPVTAIDLTRQAGTATTVRVFLGEKA